VSEAYSASVTRAILLSHFIVPPLYGGCTRPPSYTQGRKVGILVLRFSIMRILNACSLVLTKSFSQANAPSPSNYKLSWSQNDLLKVISQSVMINFNIILMLSWLVVPFRSVPSKVKLELKLSWNFKNIIIILLK